MSLGDGWSSREKGEEEEGERAERSAADWQEQEHVVPAESPECGGLGVRGCGWRWGTAASSVGRGSAPSLPSP